MARKSSEECPPAGAPAWMVTYGDMMTLLLTFFVLIVSFSSIEQVKFRAAIHSIQEGLGIWPDNAGILLEIDLDQAKKAQEAQEVIEELTAAMQELAMIESVEIYNTPSGLRVIISDPVLYQSGRAELSARFKSLLLSVAQTIKSRSFAEVRIEGHTDNVPINTPKYPSNWELSAARALAATKYLAFTGGIPADRLSAIGYGEYRPIEPNDTREGRAKNRRVEIHLEFPSE